MLSGGGHLGFHNVFRAAVSCGIIRSAGCLQWTKGMDVVGRARPCLRQMPTGTSPRLCQGCVHVRACRAHSVRSGSFVEVAEHVRPQSSRQHRSFNEPPPLGAAICPSQPSTSQVGKLCYSQTRFLAKFGLYAFMRADVGTFRAAGQPRRNVNHRNLPARIRNEDRIAKGVCSNLAPF